MIEQFKLDLNKNVTWTYRNRKPHFVHAQFGPILSHLNRSSTRATENFQLPIDQFPKRD